MPELRELRVVDGVRLQREYRDVLKPAGVLPDARGGARQLPRYFYEVPSWDAAREIALASHFHLWEFMHTDVREAPPLRVFPRYVPCAVTLTAQVLEHLREAVGAPVRIAANGGYRSPRHQLTRNASAHCWGTAVNIYRIGDVDLDSRESIERYATLARQEIPGVWTRPFGSDLGFADDHLHLDLGYVVAMPHDAPAEPIHQQLEGDPL
jgi:hypothetical protein